MTADGDAALPGADPAGLSPRDAGGPLDRARPRLRIRLDGGARIGPGKIELLEAIGRTGSVAAAGRALGMSRSRAALLVAETDRLFRQPLFLTAGAAADEARLTPFGEAVVAAYRRVEARVTLAIRDEFAPFAAYFATQDGGGAAGATRDPPDDDDAPPPAP